MLKGIVAVLLLAGCAGEEAPPGPLPKVTHEKAAVPKDRDRNAVLAAVRRLDPCKLLDPRGTAVGGLPADAKLRSQGSFTCWLDAAGDRSLRFVVTDLPTGERVGPMRSVAGAKAYVDETASTCAVRMPVSFELVIQVSWLTKTVDDPCAAPLAFAEQAATRLADDPAEVETTPHWDACTVLTTGLAADPTGYQPDDLLGGLDGCVDDHRSGPTLTMSHGRLDLSTDRIADTPVVIDETTELGVACHVSWQLGPDDHASLMADDCDLAKDTAAKVIPVTKDQPPADDPQRPLLYGPDEQDVPFPGACRHLPDVDDCQPYVRVPVPSGTEEIIRHADADPNVSCALAIDTLGDHLDAKLSAATVRRTSMCELFDEQGSVQASVAVRGEPNGPDDINTKIAGWPAERTVGGNLVMVDVGLGAEPRTGGQLLVIVHGVNEKSVRAIVEDLLNKHFGGSR